MFNPFGKKPNPYDDHDMDAYQSDEKDYQQSEDDSAEDALEAESKSDAYAEDEDDYTPNDTDNFQGEY
jgi:hypothetical protein